MAGWPFKEKIDVKKLMTFLCANCGHELPWHKFTLDKWVGPCTRKKVWRDPRMKKQTCKCKDFKLLIVPR